MSLNIILFFMFTSNKAVREQIMEPKQLLLTDNLIPMTDRLNKFRCTDYNVALNEKKS